MKPDPIPHNPPKPPKCSDCGRFTEWYYKNPICKCPKPEKEKCMMECVSCDKEFDIEVMREDGDSNYLCESCYNELKPVMDREFLIGMYNATSTETEPGSDEIESYESWLERQLLKRISIIKEC